MRDLEGLRFDPHLGEETDLNRRSERLARPIGAIVLCTKPGSPKQEGMASAIATSRYHGIPVVAMTPHRVPEIGFHVALGRRVSLVAALKTLQAPRDPDAMLRAMLGEQMLESALTGDSVFVANDVLLDVRDARGNWQTYNKPSNQSTRSEIYKLLESLLGLGNADAYQYREARLRVGAAAYCPRVRRGVAGHVERFFSFTPLSSDQIGMYVASYDPAALCLTNGACRWENSILAGHVISVDGVPRDDPQFENEWGLFQLQAQGALPEVSTLLQQVAAFKDQGSVGNLSSDLRSATGSIMLHSDVGFWNVWQPHQLAVQ